MKTQRFILLLAAGAAALSFAACTRSDTARSECSDPAAAAFELLDKQVNPSEIEAAGVTVNAQELSRCAANALGAISGYQERTIENGEVQSTSRVNVNPLSLDMSIAHPAAGSPEELIFLAGFSFAKIDGKWIELTKDNPDPAIASLLELREGLQIQFNPELRAAGTDASLEYQLVGADEILGEPVIVLEAELPTADGGSSATSRYFLTKDYLILRSTLSSGDGDASGGEAGDAEAGSAGGMQQSIERVSEFTEIGVPQEIKNPMLAD